MFIIILTIIQAYCYLQPSLDMDELNYNFTKNNSLEILQPISQMMQEKKLNSTLLNSKKQWPFVPAPPDQEAPIDGYNYPTQTQPQQTSNNGFQFNWLWIVLIVIVSLVGFYIILIITFLIYYKLKKSYELKNQVKQKNEIEIISNEVQQ